MTKTTLHISLFLLLVIFPLMECVAQKTDTLVHVNGNVLKGDFRQMEYAVVTWKMDGMGTIRVDVPYLKTFNSTKQFEIKMKSGIIYFSSFEASKVDRKVTVMSNGKREDVFIDDIVEIHPIKGNFWKKFNGNISLGGNYSKGNNATTLSFAGNLDYRNKKTYFNLPWNYNLNYLGDSITTNNSNIDFSWQRSLKKKWSTLISLGTSQNLQLGVKRRYNLTLGMVKDINYNIWNRLYVGGGLSGINEEPYDNTGKTSELAGLFRIGWEVYKLTSPKVWLNSNITYIPYITGGSRDRVNINFNPSISIINSNFKVGVTFYYSFDSEPPPGSLSNDDYGLNLQLSYLINN